jgi:hypothetical protein
MSAKPDKPDELAQYLQDLFRDSLVAYMPELKRMKRMQEAYDCLIPPDWGTMSEVYLPLVRTTVEVAVPIFMDYLMPRSGNIFSLLPSTRPISGKIVTASEDYFHHLIRNKIGLYMCVMEAMKDCAKINVGYVKVFYDIQTPLVEHINHILLGGEKVGEDRTIGTGSEQTVTSAKYVHWGRVVPTPDGGDVDEVTCTFEIDYIRSDQLMAMYEAEEDLPEEERNYMGDPKKIIEDTRAGKIDSLIYPEWFVTVNLCGGIDSIAGVDKELYNKMARRSGKNNAPVNVPIIYCYFQNEHIWLVNGKEIIRHDKGQNGTLACPISKFTSVKDSGRWAPRSDADAGSDSADGKNAMVNAVLDLFTYSLHPTAVRNRQMVNGDQDIGMEAYGEIDSYGDASKAVSYLQGPTLPNGLLNMLDMLGTENDNTTGQPSALRGQGTAGVMRGGMHGFESFLGTAFGRQKLAGAVVEQSGFKRLLTMIMIYEQVRLNSPVNYIVRDPTSNNNFIEKTITPAEFCNVFELELNLADKFMRSPSERSMDMQIAPVLLQNPTYDWDMVVAELYLQGNRDLQRKLKASPDVAEAQQKQLQEAAEREAQAKAKAQGSSLTQQADAGQASQEDV